MSLFEQFDKCSVKCPHLMIATEKVKAIRISLFECPKVKHALDTEIAAVDIIPHE